MADWKHRKAEQEVDVLLREVARQDASLLNVFPRSVEDLLTAVFGVAFESCRNLSGRIIAEILRSVYCVEHNELLVNGDAPLAGYTFARSDLAVIFSESSFGEDFERFTRAHEAGHLVIEYWPRLANSKHPTLFGEEPEPVLYARRDPPSHIFMSSSEDRSEGVSADDYRKLRADHEAWLREVKANGFAAELLAPHREVRKVVAGLPFGVRRVTAARSRFGLSRSAAEIRLAELGLLDEPATTQTLSF